MVSLTRSMAGYLDLMNEDGERFCSTRFELRPAG